MTTTQGRLSIQMSTPTAEDTYSVRVFVFEQNGSVSDLTAPDAGSFVATVAEPPLFSSTSTVTPQQAAPGQNVTITSTFTNTSSDGILSNGILDMELHDGANKQVAQNFVTESLNPGQSVTETWHVTAPSTPGTYSLQLGAFSGGWATNYY